MKIGDRVKVVAEYSVMHTEEGTVKFIHFEDGVSVLMDRHKDSPYAESYALYFDNHEVALV